MLCRLISLTCNKRYGGNLSLSIPIDSQKAADIAILASSPPWWSGELWHCFFYVGRRNSFVWVHKGAVSYSCREAPMHKTTDIPLSIDFTVAWDHFFLCFTVPGPVTPSQCC